MNLASVADDTLTPQKDMRPPKFKRGSIVAERWVASTKRIPLRIKNVVKPKRCTHGYEVHGYQYELEAEFPEDGDTFLHGKAFIEEGLICWYETKSDVIGALLSRAQDLKEL